VFWHSRRLIGAANFAGRLVGWLGRELRTAVELQGKFGEDVDGGQADGGSEEDGAPVRASLLPATSNAPWGRLVSPG
jgi:hypothetical protein